MRHRDPSPPPPAAAWRGLAGLLALFVFALACAVQSPVAHAWLHGVRSDACTTHPASTPAPDAPNDADCPVTLFAQGLTVPFTTPALLAPVALPEIPLRPRPVARASAAPARLHPPAQAPPALA